MVFTCFYWLLVTYLLISTTKSHPTTKDEAPCVYEETRRRLTCKRYFPDFADIEYPNATDVTFLNMVGYWHTVDFRVIERAFPNLETLSVLEESRKSVRRKNQGVTAMSPENVMQLKRLQMVRLGLKNLNHNFFEKLPYLQELDLRDNDLTTININPLMNVNTVYLSGNKWNCSENLDWVLKQTALKIMDLKNMTCYKMPYPGKPLRKIAKFLLDVKTNCTEKCECHLLKVVQNPSSDKFEPIVEVNCTNRGFTELPKKFPKATKILHLEGNKISDLKPLKANVSYRNLLDLYLDNNDVRSFRALEGSYWLTHFRVFSLIGNKMTELPSYALDNALQQNINMPNAVSIALGGNPWRCDCAFTPVFQELLRKYSNQVKDLRDIRCAYVEGDENSLLPILELSRSSVCRLDSEYSVQEALDCLNGILGFLIIFVLGKLAYDYYNFKKTGRLPWIVTKMP